MSDFTRFVGSSVIALILVSIPGLLIVSIALELDGLLKTLFSLATAAEGVLLTLHIYERSEE